MANKLPVGLPGADVHSSLDTQYEAGRKKIIYNFLNYFHPYVEELIEQLNKNSLEGIFDADFQSRSETFFDQYQPNNSRKQEFEVTSPKKEFDLSTDGSYSIYNWELFFHIPLAIAVHLSKNQKFAEAQEWFHCIFDPTSTDEGVKPPWRYWKFLYFRKNKDVKLIEEILINLSDQKDSELYRDTIDSINAWRDKPFDPHTVARIRSLAYQFYVVMSYLDNLIWWGDYLFRQYTMETLNEAMQLYVLAANILGPRPQEVPRITQHRPKTFAMIKDKLKDKLDPLGNFLEEAEVLFPFNVDSSGGGIGAGGGGAGNYSTLKKSPLFGMMRSLYFCIPPNQKLLSYWDTVQDRLYKIRHCMNIEGIKGQVALFQPPIDPGLLVKAAAAGIDISSVVSSLNQPLSTVRAPVLIQKALEVCGEVKALGNSLLPALEKIDAEKLALIRQEQEIKLLERVQETRFLQWKAEADSIEVLAKTRNMTFEKYRYYQYLLENKDEDIEEVRNFDSHTIGELSEDNFDEVYQELVGKYGNEIKIEDYPKEPESKYEGIIKTHSKGKNLHLSNSEFNELNVWLPASTDALQAATFFDIAASAVALIPQFHVAVKPIGIGGEVGLGGLQLSTFMTILAGINRMVANEWNFRANRSSKLATYFRREQDWVFQSNSASRELMQIGRQMISSLIKEQVAKKEYENHKIQIEHAREIDSFLKEQKYTNEEFYMWMQGEVSRIYYECYKFAFDLAKKAEQTMKHELMRNELDEMTFVKFNYWDNGRKGLLSGESLYLDIKKMELAYTDYNKREYEMVKHVSLQKLDPHALLQLKATGSCEVDIPEWVFEMDRPGLYLRRIKTVGVSIPCTVGPYASINCTLSLLKSTIRKSPLLKDGEYHRQGSEDERFIDNFGSPESVITSRAQDDSGLFERNLRDERFLPFEGAGAVSAWKIRLPSDLRQFDYNTISDCILHLSFTAREGGDQLAQKSVEYIKEIIQDAKASGLSRSFSLRHDFPNEWHKFVSSSSSGEGDDTKMKISIKKYHFPYIAQNNFRIDIREINIFAFTNDGSLKRKALSGIDLDTLNDGLNENDQAEIEIAKDQETLNPEDNKRQVFLGLSYTLSEA